jgi:hypothetical protein
VASGRSKFERGPAIFPSDSVPSQEGSDELGIALSRLKRSECINETRCVSTSHYYSHVDVIGQSKLSSVLDEASGCLRIETEKRDREKTAFSTPQGHFHLNKMCFGFMIDPATYQRCMDAISW